MQQSDLLTLHIGNDYTLLKEDEASLDRSGQFLKVHRFVLFCRVAKGDEALIRSVTFELHESFEPNTFVKTVAPFETTQTAYGFFTARVHVAFYRTSTQVFEWELRFGDGGYREVVVAGGARPTLEDVVVPENLTFGIELELLVPSRGRVHSRQEVAAYLQRHGIDARCAEYSHKAVTDYWKIVSDASVCCSRDDPHCLTFELVSPVLRGKSGLQCVEAIMGVLASVQLTVNETAGFHVHIGADPFFNLEQLKRICASFVKFEQAFDSLVPVSRRGVNNKYCKSHQQQFGSQSNPAINQVILGRNQLGGLLAVMNKSTDRYFKLNLQRVSNRDSPTLEFRQHNGTSNFEKIRAWVLLLLHFVNNAQVARPDNFAPERPVSYQRKRMFQWVIKDPILAAFYEQRAMELLRNDGNESWWTCACGKAFPFCLRLVQHQNATGHSNPSCCAKCADGH
jgi:hypothetical protein